MSQRRTFRRADFLHAAKRMGFHRPAVFFSSVQKWADKVAYRNGWYGIKRAMIVPGRRFLSREPTYPQFIVLPGSGLA